jgi:diguanylate cyclase (GGDEF)-like protein/putative nucleotidyltransferase with HDIG domain
VYIWTVLLAGAALAGQSLARLPTIPFSWVDFVGVLLLTTLAQLFEAEAPNRQLLYLHFIFFFTALLILPAPLFPIIVAIPHLVEWAKVRWLTPESPNLRQWYIQPFNIANHIICGTLAQHVLAVGEQLPLDAGITTVALYVAVALAYVCVNHLLVGLALQFARGIGLQASGVLTLNSLLPDVIMSCLGCAVAVLWSLHPAWMLMLLSPVVMMYQALMVPQLMEEAKTDGKTGLLNARYLDKAFAQEFERAERYGRPLAVLMADLDYLRNINNTYGHMAGDTVLKAIGAIIQGAIREADIAGRFGGEEFVVVLPEADRHAAETVAERIRRSVEAAAFTLPNQAAPIRATISVGVACFPDDSQTQAGLQESADIAAYEAKRRGRNRVICAADVPDAIAVGLPTMAGTHNPALPEPALVPSSPSLPQPAPEPVPPTPPIAPAPAASPIVRSERRGSMPHLLGPYVGSVIAAGLMVGLLGAPARPLPSLLLILALAAVAMLLELFQVSLYWQSTVSASVAIGVTAALLGDLSGVVAVSGAIALAHALRRRPPLYKFLFNWSVHLLAGSALVALVTLFNAVMPWPTPLPAALGFVLALPCYFLIDVGLVAIVVSLASRARLRVIWQNEFSWLRVHYLVLGLVGGFIAMAYWLIGLVGIALSVLPLLLIRYAQQQYVTHTTESIRELKRINQELQQTNRALQQASETVGQLNLNLSELNDELLASLARLFDARDSLTGTHVMQVAHYATLVGQELGIEGERLKRLRWAAFLHDIGKIAISERILFKPDKLSAEEYAQIKTHPTVGAELLIRSTATRDLAEFVRQHHERWDGRGYPLGLQGEAISLEGRVLNLCDSVEAMAADRPYSRGRSPEEVLAEVRRCAGTQFDPQIVEAFLRVVEREGPGLLRAGHAREQAPVLAEPERAQSEEWHPTSCATHEEHEGSLP